MGGAKYYTFFLRYSGRKWTVFCESQSKDLVCVQIDEIIYNTFVQFWDGVSTSASHSRVGSYNTFFLHYSGRRTFLRRTIGFSREER